MLGTLVSTTLVPAGPSFRGSSRPKPAEVPQVLSYPSDHGSKAARSRSSTPGVSKARVRLRRAGETGISSCLSASEEAASCPCGSPVIAKLCRNQDVRTHLSRHEEHRVLVPRCTLPTAENDWPRDNVALRLSPGQRVGEHRPGQAVDPSFFNR